MASQQKSSRSRSGERGGNVHEYIQCTREKFEDAVRCAVGALAARDAPDWDRAMVRPTFPFRPEHGSEFVVDMTKFDDGEYIERCVSVIAKPKYSETLDERIEVRPSTLKGLDDACRLGIFAREDIPCGTALIVSSPFMRLLIVSEKREAALLDVMQTGRVQQRGMTTHALVMQGCNDLQQRSAVARRMKHKIEQRALAQEREFSKLLLEPTTPHKIASIAEKPMRDVPDEAVHAFVLYLLRAHTLDFPMRALFFPLLDALCPRTAVVPDNSSFLGQQMREMRKHLADTISSPHIDFLLRYLGVLALNIKGYAKPEFVAARLRHDPDADDGKVLALFLTASLFNHSCQPNAQESWPRKEEITISATRDIRAGEEIYLSYGERDMLQFKCGCVSCGRSRATRFFR